MLFRDPFRLRSTLSVSSSADGEDTLKISDHTDLAKLHAEAVRDAGDGALAELVEFQQQLGVASKDAHQSWTAAFARELPEAAKKMSTAIQLMAKAAQATQATQATQMKQPASTAEGSSPQSPEGGNGDANLKGASTSDTLGTAAAADKLKHAPRKPDAPERTAECHGRWIRRSVSEGTDTV